MYGISEIVIFFHVMPMKNAKYLKKKTLIMTHNIMLRSHHICPYIVDVYRLTAADLFATHKLNVIGR